MRTLNGLNDWLHYREPPRGLRLATRWSNETMNKASTTLTMLLTPKQAAQELQISERKLWQMRKEGKIRAVRFGRSVRYDRADLEAAINAAKT